MYKWSMFCIRSFEEGGVLIKNMLSGAVVFINTDSLKRIESWLNSRKVEIISEAKDLLGENALIVPRTKNEVAEYTKLFFETREGGVDQLVIHFLPTIGCQLSCSYCFENGAERSQTISDDLLGKSVEWVAEYLNKFPAITNIKFVLFGGEPLTRKEVIKKALPQFAALAKEKKRSFQTELVSNGELLDREFAEFLAQHNWQRFQVTLDGPREIHNAKRFGNNKRPTFDRIVSNIERVLHDGCIPKIDVRINYDAKSAIHVPELIEFLSGLEHADRMQLSLGQLVETFNGPSSQPGLASFSESDKGAKAMLSLWSLAKEKGFKIPEEYSSGPWCVATEKHTVVIQPSGGLQKCICTVGRQEYDFSSVDSLPENYAQDVRFEKFKRTDQCKEEECPFMPVCGGGCPWDSIVANGEKGFEMRFCEKEKLRAMNEGLLHLKYGAK